MATVITKEFILEGLCCPVCAKKIEHGAHALQGVNSANLDFMAQRLTLELAEQSDAQQIVREITELVRHAEPDVRIHERRAAEQMAQAQRASRVRYLRLGGGFILFAAGLLLSVPAWSERLLFLLSYLIVGGDILWRALKNITRGHIFDENFLMSIATIGAFALGEYPEGVAVMLFYQVGEAFQDHAVGRSRASISALMDIRPDFANLKIAGETRRVAPEEVSVGDFILVQPGEKIPLDGTVSAGYAALDTSALTGESLPRDVEPGSAVLSGSINQNGLLTIQVTKIFAESTVSKILHLVQNASAQKAPLENFISKFARYYTPAVVFAAFALAVIPPLVIPGAHFADWLNRALVFLVVSCPCALVISIPLSFFGGIGGASRSGILVKGSHYLEGLHDVDTIIFDKTGTLTQGIFQVRDIVAANEFSREALLDYAVHAESHSTHPIALSIRSAYQQPVSTERISSVQELAGKGLCVQVDGKTVLAGNSKLLDSAGISYPDTENPGTIVYVAVNGVYAGMIVMADEVKPDSAAAISQLKSMGIKNIAMFTGDTRHTSESIGQKAGVDSVYAELLPHEKLEKLAEIARDKNNKRPIVFVGDGINDAPVLARAEIGVAMGGVGSDAAIEAADIVLMTDEPSKLVTAMQIAKKTHGIVWQNIIFALGVKGVILALGALGIASMWEAVFGDVGVAVIAILNALRAMRAP